VCPNYLPGAFEPMPLGDDYSAFPTVVEIPAGLRAVWWQGNDHLSYGTSRLFTTTSSDSGASWTAPEFLRWSIGVRDPNVSRQADDRHWLTYFTGFQSLPALGAYARLSRDGGATWGTPRRVDPRLPYAAVSAPIRAEGPGGRDTLWLPFYGRERDDATGDLEEFDSAYIARSVDGGANWTSTRIADGAADERSYAEPWLVLDENQPGRMLVFHRHGAWQSIGLTESTDGGQSWSAPRELFPGTGRPTALATSTGQLVVVYRDATTRDAVYAVSTDDGATWNAGQLLMENHNSTQLGMVYAAMVETAPGEVYTLVSMEDNGVNARLWHGHLVCAG